MSIQHHKKRRKQNFAFALTLALIGSVSVLQGGCAAPSEGDASASAAASPDSEESLLIEADDQAMALEKEPSDIESRLVKIRISVLRTLAANIAVGEKALISGKVALDLSRGQREQVLLDQVEKVAEENIIFTGKIAGDLDSAVTIVVNEGVVAADFRRSDSTQAYQIRNVAGDAHSLILKEDDPESSCEEVPDDSVDGSDPSLSPQAVPQEEADYYATGAVPVIDVLAAYTPSARARQGGRSGIQALIQMGIADTNRALSDSGVSLQVRLVGTMETRTNETGAWSSDLSRLAGTSDGKWDEIHAERNRLGADQVSLVGVYSGSSTAGIGYINASAAKAFTITKVSAFSQYSFTHELGHNLGLQHSDGYVNSRGRFRTIIAYGSYPRIRRFSNPSLKYNGYLTGDSGHNEVAVLRRGASRVASLRTTKVSADLSDQ